MRLNNVSSLNEIIYSQIIYVQLLHIQVGYIMSHISPTNKDLKGKSRTTTINNVLIGRQHKN